MPDREKVITHFKDAIEASGNNNKWRFVRVDVINDALELLNEQEPVEPKLVQYRGYNYWECAVCGVELEYKQHYCGMCGKAVKWDA